PTQRTRKIGEHLIKEFTNLTGCTRGNNNVPIISSTVETRQRPLNAWDEDVLVPQKEEIEVGAEKCNVEIPAEEGAALGGKDTVQGKGENSTITMENEKITEKGEETAACKTIGANGTKKEGKMSDKLQIKGLENIPPEGAFHASGYPAKLASFGATGQILQIGKTGEVNCSKVNYYSGESLVQDSAVIRLLPQYVECEYKIGGLKGKPTMEPGECEFSYHLEKGKTVGEATFECLESAMKITGPLGCEIKIGESGNLNLKEIVAANVATKPKTIEIKNNISGINVESNSSCEVFGLEKGKVGKYSGTIKVEAGSAEGAQLGLEIT
ncbi:MAG: hypothetical protein ACHQDY_08100, partial [Solirubrobacterales bacterium]